MRSKPIKTVKEHAEVTKSIIDFKDFAKKRINRMHYKVQKVETKSEEFYIYMVAPNGENCKVFAKCKDEKDANMIASTMNNQMAIKES